MNVRTLIQRIRRRIGPIAPRPLILMYHRIADPPVDPWGLAVSPARFEAHVAAIRRTRQPLTMSEFVDNLERGTLPNDAVAVTFDDGYADNLHEARPRLAAAGVPATLFLTTGAIGQRTEYWWDELARAILLRADALECEVVIAGEPCRLAFATAGSEDGARAWRAWDAPHTAREAAYLAVWQRLRTVSATERESVMCRLREWLLPPPPDPRDLPMAPAEVAEFAADRRFEIGGHTATHPVLPSLDPAERRREILDGRLACERLINRPIAGFAYPHGALDADSRAAVRECGFRWACSTESRPVPSRGYDEYALPRLAILDWERPAFERALRDCGGRS